MTEDELLSAYAVGYGSADAPSERHTYGVRAVESLVRRTVIDGMPNLILLMFSEDLDYSYREIEERIREVLEGQS